MNGQSLIISMQYSIYRRKRICSGLIFFVLNSYGFFKILTAENNYVYVGIGSFLASGIGAEQQRVFRVVANKQALCCSEQASSLLYFQYQSLLAYHRLLWIVFVKETQKSGLSKKDVFCKKSV